MFPLTLATFTHQTRDRKFPNKKSFTATTCTLDALGPAPTHQILATALRTLRDPGMSRAEDSDRSRPSSWTDDLLLRKSFAFCSDSCARSVIVSFFLRGGLSGWTRLFLLRLSINEVAVFLGGEQQEWPSLLPTGEQRSSVCPSLGFSRHCPNQ